MTYDVCVVGHVGAPLASVLAARGLRTFICDINEAAVTSIMKSVFPLRRGRRRVSVAGGAGIRQSRRIVADRGRREGGNRRDHYRHPDRRIQNPVWDAVSRCVDALLPHLRGAQLLILRSTVSPGTTDRLQQYLVNRGFNVPVAFDAGIAATAAWYRDCVV